MVTIDTYGMIGELDINNMTEKFSISKNETNTELFINLSNN